MTVDSLLATLTLTLCAFPGHEHVKAGLILGLFGGSRPQSHARDRLSVRTDAHILVVGDPGLGKSQMLRAVSQVAPRSVYVCANTTTASGLTVTVSKEAGGGGDVALEAGALVLSDQGVVSLPAKKQPCTPPTHTHTRTCADEHTQADRHTSVLLYQSEPPTLLLS